MRIVGIDPGYAIVGFGVVDYNNNSFFVQEFGAITTVSHAPFNERLKIIYDDLCYLLDKYKPDEMAVEKLFFNTNQKTAIDVAQARGVIILAAQQRGIKISEYTPLQVKQSVVGYGRAEKKQVQELTRQILKLQNIPKPDDAADALALAVCHGHSANNLLKNLTF